MAGAQGMKGASGENGNAERTTSAAGIGTMATGAATGGGGGAKTTGGGGIARRTCATDCVLAARRGLVGAMGCGAVRLAAA